MMSFKSALFFFIFLGSYSSGVEAHTPRIYFYKIAGDLATFSLKFRIEKNTTYLQFISAILNDLKKENNPRLNRRITQKYDFSKAVGLIIDGKNINTKSEMKKPIDPNSTFKNVLVTLLNKDNKQKDTKKDTWGHMVSTSLFYRLHIGGKLHRAPIFFSKGELTYEDIFEAIWQHFDQTLSKNKRTYSPEARKEAVIHIYSSTEREKQDPIYTQVTEKGEKSGHDKGFIKELENEICRIADKGSSRTSIQLELPYLTATILVKYQATGNVAAKTKQIKLNAAKQPDYEAVVENCCAIFNKDFLMPEDKIFAKDYELIDTTEDEEKVMKGLLDFEEPNLFENKLFLLKKKSLAKRNKQLASTTNKVAQIPNSDKEKSLSPTLFFIYFLVTFTSLTLLSCLAIQKNKKNSKGNKKKQDK